MCPSGMRIDPCSLFYCPQVQFLGAVTKHQPFMIVTEFMTGGSLLDLFKSNNSFSMWRAVQLALDCARGMAYLHNRSPHAVIHRGEGGVRPASRYVESSPCAWS